MALGVPVAFGTDMNGMIESLGPRFASGEDSCSWAYRHCGSLAKLGRLVGSCDAYKDERAMQQAIQGSASQNGIHTDFDTKGFARYRKASNRCSWWIRSARRSMCCSGLSLRLMRRAISRSSRDWLLSIAPDLTRAGSIWVA